MNNRENFCTEAPCSIYTLPVADGTAEMPARRLLNTAWTVLIPLFAMWTSRNETQALSVILGRVFVNDILSVVV